jgi:hypothetical protein
VRYRTSVPNRHDELLSADRGRCEIPATASEQAGESSCARVVRLGDTTSRAWDHTAAEHVCRFLAEAC